MVDDGIEAVYMLDFLTGDLRAAVLNPNTRNFLVHLPASRWPRI